MTRKLVLDITQNLIFIETFNFDTKLFFKKTMGDDPVYNARDVFQSKSNYVDQVKNIAKQFQYVVIYGAGKIAKPLYQLISKNGIPVVAFCVTAAAVNKNQEFGIPILQVSEMSYEQNSTLILIGVKKKWSKEVKETLDRYGYKNYIDLPMHAEYFDDKIIDKLARPVLEITPKIGCRINCKFCPQSLLRSRYYISNDNTTNMTFDTFKICIDKTPDNLMIDFAGFAEPFLNPDSIQMIRYASQLGRDISLYTTLVGLNKESFNMIKDIDFREVVLHTPDEDGYANIPMTEEYFEVLDLIVNAKKPNGDPFIYSANCQNIPHPKVLEHTQGKLRIFSELGDRAGNLEASDIFSHKNITGTIACSRAENLDHGVLLPDGSVVLCCMDYGMEHVLGNLLEQSYEDVLNGTEMLRVKKAMQEDNGGRILCRNCSSAVVI